MSGVKRLIVLFWMVFWCCWGGWGQLTARALPPAATYEGATVVDVGEVTFSDFPAIGTAGELAVGQIAERAGVSAQRIVGALGYDPSRSWSPGTPLAQIYKLGDFGETLASWSLKSIAGDAGRTLLNESLDNFPYLQKESIRDLAGDIPGLRELKVRDSPVLADLVRAAIGSPAITYTRFEPLSSPGAVPEALADYLKKFDAGIQTERALRQVLDSPLEKLLSGRASFDFSDGPLSGRLDFAIDTATTLDTLDLSQYGIGDLPKFEEAEFGSFEGWKGSFLQDIPNLPLVPALKFAGGLTAPLGAVGKVDIAFGEREANRTNTVSGSYQDGFEVPCELESCAHIELTDASDNPLHALKGKQWISGNSQQVNGGSGLLKAVNGGKEPTGRHPFGDAFKVILTAIDESAGTADFGVNFRICMDWLGCTPYYIGPFPWFSQKEKDLIFLGLDGVEAPIPVRYPALPRPNFESYRKDLPTPERFVNTAGVVGAADDPCATYKGVNLWAFREAIARKESTGNYYAVGVYVSDTQAGLRGRALGRYQFMTYREDVSSAYLSTGGAKHIEGAKDPGYSKAVLSQSISQHFPPPVQEKFWRDWSPRLIDRAYSRGLRGAELISRAASYHLTGLGGAYNPSYGGAVWNYYQSYLSAAEGKCEAKVAARGGEVPLDAGSEDCSSGFIRPTSGPVTSGFGYRIHPITRNRRLHKGIDVAPPQGTTVVASSTGVVRRASAFGGYGNTIDILHCNGRTTRYAHLMNGGISVRRGQRVARGSPIGRVGSTGASTGPHLHFEVHVNGSAFNPKNFVKF